MHLLLVVMIQGKVSLAERGVYVSRKRRSQAHQAIMSHWKKNGGTLAEISNDCLDTSSLPQGSRIMDMGNILAAIAEVSAHSAVCGGTCVIDGDVMHSGLAVVVKIRCTKCAQMFRLRWLVNVAAVLGQMSTGGGATALNSILTLMDIPRMPKSMLSATERLIGDDLHGMLTAKMAEAGQEEKRQAIERKDYHQGVPAITVVGDGGGSKQSHKHSYNARVE